MPVSETVALIAGFKKEFFITELAVFVPFKQKALIRGLFAWKGFM